MTYYDILRNIKTVDEVNRLVSEIDILLDSLFKADTNAFEKALNSISVVTSQALKDTFLKNNANLGNYAMIKDLLIKLKEELQKFKVLKLSLAFEVSEGSIDNLFAWVLTNLGSGIILDIKEDKKIIGGASIEFEGKYKDLTLKKKLEEVFGSKREEILTQMSS